jgi:tetratricopeptide (TPR) repeat protein
MSEVLKDLFESGKCQEVLDQFTQKEIQGEWAALSEEEQIECIYYKCRSLEWLCRYEEALQTVTMARTTYPSPTNQGYLLALLAAQFNVFYAMGTGGLDEAQSVLTDGEAIMEALTDKERQTGALWIAIFDNIKGKDLSRYKHEYDTALEYHHKALTSFEALDNPHGIAQCLYDMTDTCYRDQAYDTALEYYQQSLTLYESLGNKPGIAACLHDIGLMIFWKGELDTALEYFQRGLSFAEASDCPTTIALLLTHSGHIYSVKGDPDKALEYFRRSLAVVEPLNHDGYIAYIFNYIGLAYHQKGALDIALSFFQSALAKREAQKNDLQIVRLLYHLILLTLDQQEADQAQQYQASLQKVATRIPDNVTVSHLRARVAKALVLKQSPRMTEKARAQTLLRQIVNEEVYDSEVTMTAMVALVDLFLFELKATGDPEVWEETKALVHQFYTKAQDHQEISMVVNALLLRAKFAAVEGELDQAIKYFNEAKVIAKEKKLNSLVKKVEIEQKEFEADFQKWQGLIQRHTSLKERLVQAQLEEYIQEAQKIINRISLTGER